MKTTIKTAAIALAVAPLASAASSSFTPITLGQLQSIYPQGNPSKLSSNLPYLNSAMQEANINTPQEQAAFLGQVGAETGQLNQMTENANGNAYNGILGNGPNDGATYKGRGALQLTGATNYKNAGNALGVDFTKDPNLVSTPDYAFRTAGWYWDANNLNKLADNGQFSKITQAVVGKNALNVPTTHEAEREGFYNSALGVLNQAAKSDDAGFDAYTDNTNANTNTNTNTDTNDNNNNIVDDFEDDNDFDDNDYDDGDGDYDDYNDDWNGDYNDDGDYDNYDDNNDYDDNDLDNNNDDNNDYDDNIGGGDDDFGNDFGDDNIGGGDDDFGGSNDISTPIYSTGGDDLGGDSFSGGDDFGGDDFGGDDIAFF